MISPASAQHRLLPRRRLGRRLALVSALALMTSPAFAAEFDLPSRIDQVTVFPDGASVTRRFAVDVPAGEHVVVLGDLPLTADPGSLRIAGAGDGALIVGSVDARQPRAFERPDPERVQKLEALRDERQSLDDRIAAERLRKRAAEALVSSSVLSGGERGLNVAEARLALAAVVEETNAADTAIRAAALRQRAIDREIAVLDAGLRAQPPRRLEARISIDARAAYKGELTVTYAVRNARWLPVYDARLTTTGTKPALELVRRAEIRQETGEAWENVTLGVSTARVSRGGAAPQLQPMVLRLQEPRYRMEDSVSGGASRSLAVPAPAAPIAGRVEQNESRAQAAPVTEAEAVVEAGGFQAVFHIPGRSTVASGETERALRIGSMAIEPQLVSRAVPSVDPTAFLEAQFKHADDVPLMPGRVSLYRDGVFAGRSQLKAATREEPLTLGFGPDDMIKVEHRVFRQTEGSAGLMGSSRVDQREFRISVHNGASTPRRIVIEDRVPVTENQELKVETLPNLTQPTTRDVRGRRGIVEWAFDLAPGATSEIRHGWRLRWPAEKILGPIGRS
ncbi:mucoidy inhibitor MuiA family protein [Phreatobacter aquaticus]|uniref:Mucoidy inhibitor MuiA family protein n=1 Tax=Phreatobacter aquaticus TaxID=2570229 RepID=A0A4D7QLE0_9HYPH|nr:mucoidy inhibitor MuiA family protein [Phreatobacter aquaticus]QCK88428.1 mucoidy inhibitor MuiA family protein [Phreatobacter aquaticus]